MEAVIDKLKEDTHNLRERVSVVETKTADLEEDVKEQGGRLRQVELGQAKLMVIYGAITMIGSAIGATLTKLIFG